MKTADFSAKAASVIISKKNRKTVGTEKVLLSPSPMVT